MCLKALTASVITQVKNHRKHFNIGNFHPPYFFVHNKGTCMYMYLYLFFMQKYDTFCEWVLNKPNIGAHFVPVLFLCIKGSYFVENVLESMQNRGSFSIPPTIIIPSYCSTSSNLAMKAMSFYKQMYFIFLKYKSCMNIMYGTSVAVSGFWIGGGGGSKLKMVTSKKVFTSGLKSTK